MVKGREMASVRTLMRRISGAARGASAVVQPQLASEIRGRITTSIAIYAAETVRDVAVEQLIDVGWTHIADSLNLNYGTTRMLEVIQDELSNAQGPVPWPGPALHPLARAERPPYSPRL